MRNIGPKNRLARRQGADLELKSFGTKGHGRLLRSIEVPPGQHGTSRKRRKPSEMSKQLREKQKLRHMFGVTEKQMTNYFAKAKSSRGNTGKKLCELLESRLDNVLFRAGMAPTRQAARQLVTHGHVLVKGKKMSIASYHTSQGETISFAKESTAKIPHIDAMLSNPEYKSPEWIKREGNMAEVVSAPSSETLEKQINLRLVIEFYSK